MEFDNEIYGQIESNLFTPTKIRTMKITGTIGLAEIDFIKQDITLYTTPNNQNLPGFHNSILEPSKVNVISPYIQKKEPLKLELKHFLECISTKNVPLTDGHEGLMNLEVAEKILLSSEKNIPLHISH